MLGLRYCAGFSLVVESGGNSLVAVHRLLIEVASLVAEPGLSGGLSDCNFGLYSMCICDSVVSDSL